MRSTLHGLVFVVAALVALAVGIDNLARPLANPDEGRYSEISREMAASGDWVTPRLNGIKYFEKPPLQYWATALAFEAFGVNEVAARLYVALSAVLTILIVAFTAWRIGGPPLAGASLAALVSSPYFMAMGGAVTLDMGLTLWTTATFCAFVLAGEEADDPAARRRWMIAAWIAIAFAVLSKGLVGIVFPAAMVGLHCIVHRDFRILRHLEWLRGLGVMLAITAPWFVLVSTRNPEFAQFFFVHEHFARFLTHVHRRTEPFWYFIPIVFVGFLPWMFALPSAVAHAWRIRDERARRALRFALFWSLFIIVFFSASGSKLPSYVLPAFPPLALVLGRYLLDVPPRRMALLLWLSTAVAIAFCVVLWFLPDTAREPWVRALYVDARPWFLGGMALLAAALATAAMACLRGARWTAMGAALMGMAFLLGGAELGYRVLLPRQSGHGVAQVIRGVATPQTRVYQVKMYDQTVPFYLQRITTIVDYGDEFELGFLSEPGSHVDRWWDFFAEWERPGDAVAIMQPEIYKKFRALDLPMQVLHEDSRRVLVRKP